MTVPSPPFPTSLSALSPAGVSFAALSGAPPTAGVGTAAPPFGTLLADAADPTIAPTPPSAPTTAPAATLGATPPSPQMPPALSTSPPLPPMPSTRQSDAGVGSALPSMPDALPLGGGKAVPKELVAAPARSVQPRNAETDRSTDPALAAVTPYAVPRATMVVPMPGWVPALSSASPEDDTTAADAPCEEDEGAPDPLAASLAIGWVAAPQLPVAATSPRAVANSSTGPIADGARAVLADGHAPPSSDVPAPPSGSPETPGAAPSTQSDLMAGTPSPIASNGLSPTSIVPIASPPVRIDAVPTAPVATIERGDRARPAATAAPAQIAPPVSAAALTHGPAAQVFGAAIAAVRREERTLADTPVDAATVQPIIVDRAVDAPDAAHQAPLDMAQQRWPQAMVDRIAHLADAAAAQSAHASETTIRLAPDALGTIAVAIRRDGDAVAVHFQADQPATRGLLLDAQDRLADIANARGLRLSETSVGAGGGGDPGTNRSHPQSQPVAPRAPRRATIADGVTTDTATPDAALRVA